jgi:serine phosphatase RsbU (regulator of sigma subunit)
LHNGKYIIAADILSSILILLTIAGFLDKIISNPHTGFTSYVYLMFSVLVFSGMFCSRKFLLSASFLFVCAVIFFRTIVSYNKGFHDDNLAVASMVLSVFSILSVTTLTYLFVRIGEKAILRAEYLADELKNLADNLEKKVELRTEELQSAMEELEAMNAQLLKTSDALWGEMELARKIQTVLLPKLPLITGYEISAYMNPASEIGGDYYDIINAEGYDWVVIGDVSGHGIPAGLVMMMVQTAVHSVLEQNPGQSPTELLKHINRAVSKNIQLLDEDKYMTITVFLAIENGEFIFSGLHQDILIYRSATGKIDVVETTGSWIGLLGEVKGVNRDAKINLNIGDTMLVYTDGIIEAWEKGSEIDNRSLKQMFGEERLISIFSENGVKSTDDIKKSIIEKLNDYDCPDDVTMVIIKRVP